MTSPSKYICIHGHFYQPPRENPWLEEIEVQDSARPFHDWNERIQKECYAPNALSRLLDGQGRIAEMVNNYAHISFNFGPTLLTWMEKRDNAAYRRILDTDRASVRARGGHGNALAQAYSHMILPLAHRRDKETQVIWGRRDFEKRFGRAPEGMWLPETAVDTETLDILADQGIRFTILSPDQALRVRPVDGKEADWRDVSGGRVDPSRAYRWTSPAGRTMTLFFYDAPISRAIAFEGLLSNGESLKNRLLGGFSAERDGAQLVNVATDGESYGHHHRFGDMALAYALRKIQGEKSAVLTNYGEFLANHPPLWEAQIVENSSWSCAHGVERWRADCGCRVGGGANWTQAWRAPLRESLDALRDALDRLFESKAGGLLKDPWAARNDYIDVLFDRSPDSLGRFFDRHRSRALQPAEEGEALRLLEMQRHRMFMFTSCGWFFDDISGLESVTVLLSAARAVQLARGFTGDDLEADLMKGLAKAKSNVPDLGHGAAVYERYVRPQVTDLPRVAAHEAIRSLFQETPAEGRVYVYSFRFLDAVKEESAGSTLAVGRIRVSAEMTRESYEAAFAALHVGGQDFHGVLKASPDASSYEALKDDLLKAFRRGSLTDVLRLFGQRFDPRTFALPDLFLEDRRRILNAVIQDILGRFDGAYRMMVEENRKLMNHLKDMDFPVPQAFRLALHYVLSRDLEEALAAFPDDGASVQRLVELRTESRKFAVPLDLAPAADLLRRRVEADLTSLTAEPRVETARQILKWLDLADRLDIKPDLWAAENLFYDLWKGRLALFLDLSKGNDPAVQTFLALADRFRFKLPVALS